MKSKAFTDEQKANAAKIKGGLVRILLAYPNGKRAFEYWGPATKKQVNAGLQLIIDITTGHKARNFKVTGPGRV